MRIKAKWFGEYLLTPSFQLDLLIGLTKTAEKYNMNVIIDLEGAEVSSWTLEQLPATIKYINQKEFQQYRGY